MAQTESESEITLGSFKVTHLPILAENTMYRAEYGFVSFNYVPIATLYEYDPETVRAIAYIDPETGIMRIMCNGDVKGVSTYTSQYSGHSAGEVIMLREPDKPDGTFTNLTSNISNVPYEEKVTPLPYSYYVSPYVNGLFFQALDDINDENVVTSSPGSTIPTPIMNKTLQENLTPNDFYANYVGGNSLTGEQSVLYEGDYDFIKDGKINPNYVGCNTDIKSMAKVWAQWYVIHDSKKSLETKASHWYPYIEGIYVTNNFQQAVDYINNGAIGDDILYSEEQKSPDDDFQNEDGTNGRNGDNLEPSKPIVSAQELNGTNIYLLTASNMNSLIGWFNDTDISQILENFVTGKYNNLAQAVISIFDYPVKPEYIGASETMSNIVVATKDTEISVKSLKKTPPLVNIGSIKLDDSNFKGLHGNTFVDYAPHTDVMIYLPFAGWKRLDSNLVMYSTVKVEAMFDALTGKVTYFVESSKQGLNWTVDIFEAKFATSLSFTLENATQTLTSLYSHLASSTVNAVGAVTASNPIQIAQSAIGFGYNGSPSIEVVGSAGEQAGLYSPKRCAIMIKSPSYNRPKNYGHHIGYPCMKSRKLDSKDLKGLTICENPFISFDSQYPTNDEVEEIYNLLTEGVYL